MKYQSFAFLSACEESTGKRPDVMFDCKYVACRKHNNNFEFLSQIAVSTIITPVIE